VDGITADFACFCFRCVGGCRMNLSACCFVRSEKSARRDANNANGGILAGVLGLSRRAPVIFLHTIGPSAARGSAAAAVTSTAAVTSAASVDCAAAIDRATAAGTAPLWRRSRMSKPGWDKLRPNI
jgi:hypothetical protein